MLLDNVLAERRSRTTPGFVTHAEPVAVSHYVGVLAPGNEALRDRIDQILREAMRDGRLEAIYRKWKIWNDDQPQLFSKVLAGDADSAGDGLPDRQHRDAAEVGSDAPISAVAAARGRDHARAVVRRDAVAVGPRRGNRDRAAVRQPDRRR